MGTFCHYSKPESKSRSVTSRSLWPRGSPRELYSPWNSPGQNPGVGGLSLLQGIFLSQGSNHSLPHCKWILYQLSHKGSPRILEWVAYPFSSGSSQPRNRTRVSCIASGFFTRHSLKGRPRCPQFGSNKILFYSYYRCLLIIVINSPLSIFF